MKKRHAPRREKKKHRTNREIEVDFVRLVGDNVENEIVSIDKAVSLAEEQEVDLVEIAPNSDPPVCRVMDYNKFLYEQKKKQKEIKAKAAKTEVKEIRFGPNTDEHDVEFKKKHAINFLSEGNKVRAFVFFRGRTIIFKDRGKELLLNFADSLKEYGKLDQQPKMEGKKMIIILTPIKQ